ncbi:MAG: glycosyltransferase, partial [Chloroflexaceae bacterium]|nr:glycosyltransferase [Chloroflexaceae bacterium]
QPGDFLRDGWNGFHVPADDAAALREKIQYLLNRPDEVARMGENAHRTIVEQFSLEHYTNHVLSSLRQQPLP